MLRSDRILFIEGVYISIVLSVLTDISNIACKKIPFVSNFIEQNQWEADSQLVKKLFLA